MWNLIALQPNRIDISNLMCLLYNNIFAFDWISARSNEGINIFTGNVIDNFNLTPKYKQVQATI